MTGGQGAQQISIHAPRMGCDGGAPCRAVTVEISIHAPRMGCDNRMVDCAKRPRTFQSTHPVWGATKRRTSCRLRRHISIHAPRMGCDSQRKQILTHSVAFQSTHPVWGATIDPRKIGAYKVISIHAPRMGCDIGLARVRRRAVYFNPRTPYGVRQYFDAARTTSISFQSTHPVWGATP